jgi:hypothetical protein
VQLTTAQLEALRSLATAEGESMSSLVRQAVDRLLEGRALPPELVRERALAAVGAYASGDASGAADHDRHLADAYRE